MGIKLCLCLMLPLLITSCEKRDPQAEYDTLRESVFSSYREGEAAAQEYIDYFFSKNGARITEVSEIRNQFRQMDTFFSNSFSSYSDFLSQSRELNDELSHSNYACVRNTWTSLYERERNNLLEPLMNSITESSFDTFFTSQARQLSENEFNIIWNIESVDRVSLATPRLVNDGTAKECSGEYRIHLRSNTGLFSSTATISIEGIIGLNEYGNIIERRTGYQFTDRPLLR